MSETKSSYYTVPDQQQFLRYAQVTIKNFKKQEKLVIGNEFEIEFDYFKTLDQTKEDDSGKVVIYGLTPETIALLEEEGGEVWLDCGYQYSHTQTLFVAYISKVYSESINNTSVTTIECSANLLSHFYSGFATEGDETALPLIGLLSNFSVSLGYPYMTFSDDNFPTDKKELLKEFINTYKTNYYSIGDVRTVMEQVCEHFGLTSQRGLIKEREDSLIFSFSDLGIKKALKIIEKGYAKVDSLSAKAQDSIVFFGSTLKAIGSEDNTAGILLTKDTGLIEAKNEYQIIASFQNESLNANEVETAESVYKRNNPDESKKKSNLSNSQIQPIGNVNNTAPTGGDSQNPFVSNTDLQGLRIKPDLAKGTNIREATGGGNARIETVSLAFRVQNMLGSELIRFTAFNDVYHQKNSPTSLHRQGKSFDFTITTAHKGANAVKNKVEALAKSLNVRVNVDDEYNFPSSKATSGHIHVDIYGKGTGDTAPSTIPQNQNLNTEEKEEKGDPYGRIPIEISRRYNRITALLNPFVLPQSIIYTEEKGTNYLLAHRVRHATYNGNNKRGEWTMVLYCEDSRSNNVIDRKVESTPTSVELSTEPNLIDSN